LKDPSSRVFFLSSGSSTALRFTID
jgi:hypothetical protein